MQFCKSNPSAANQMAVQVMRSCVVVCCRLPKFSKNIQHLEGQCTARIISIYLEAVQAVFKKYSGILCHFTQDKVVGMFLGQDRHLQQENAAIVAACNAALKLNEIVKQSEIPQLWQEDSQGPNVPELAVGIHSASATTVGNIGTWDRFKYGPVGLDVEIATRLASLAGTYRETCLLTHRTAGKVQSRMAFSFDVGTLSVDGVEHRFAALADVASQAAKGHHPEVLPYRSGSMASGIPLSNSLSWDEESFHSSESVMEHEDPFSEVTTVKATFLTGTRVVVFLSVLFVIVGSVANYFAQESVFTSELGRTRGIFQEVSDNLVAEHVSEILYTSSSAVQQIITAVPKCSEAMARDFRTGMMNLSDAKSQEWSSVKGVMLFNSWISGLGTSTDKYVAANQLGKVYTFGPEMEFNSNFYNTPPNNVTEHTDTSMITMPMNSQLEPILSEAYLAVKGYKASGRPWYQAARRDQIHAWSTPYWGASRDTMMISTGVPVYDDSGLPKYVPDESGTIGGVQESLVAVMSCAHSISLLDTILPTLNLGARGMVMVIETTGSNDGLLIAAATANESIPVHVFEDGATRPTRMFAVEHANEVIRRTSKMILDGRDSWVLVDETTIVGLESDFTFNMTGSSGHNASASNGTSEGKVMIQVAKLNSNISDWRMTTDGTWSQDQYPVTKMRWLVVLTVFSDDFITIGSYVSDYEAAIGRTVQLRFALSLVMAASALIVSALFTSAVFTNFVTIREQMSAVTNLNLEKGNKSVSRVRELQELQSSFYAMREFLGVVQKYVQADVVEAIQSGNSSRTREIGNLGMSNFEGICLCCRITNYHQVVAQVGPFQMHKIMAVHLRECFNIIDHFGGTMNDFDDCTFSAFWTGTRTPTEGELPPAIRSCLAAIQLLKESDRLHQNLEKYDFESLETTISIRCTIAITSGTILVGTYGTEERLKYGAVGSPLDRAVALPPIAKKFNKEIVIDDNSRDLVYGAFQTQYLTTQDEIIHSLEGMANGYVDQAFQLGGDFDAHGDADMTASAIHESVQRFQRKPSVVSMESTRHSSEVSISGGWGLVRSAFGKVSKNESESLGRAYIHKEAEATRNSLSSPWASPGKRVSDVPVTVSSHPACSTVPAAIV